MQEPTFLPEIDDGVRESAQTIAFRARLLDAARIAARRILQENPVLEQPSPLLHEKESRGDPPAY